MATDLGERTSEDPGGVRDAAPSATGAPRRGSRSGSGAAPLAIARWLAGSRALIIGGHGVARVPRELDPHNLCVAPDRFRAQVELLLDAGFQFTSIAALAKYAAAGTAPPPGLAALSFDDGMENNASVLLPLLREYELPATVYVTTGLIGEPNPWMHPRARARMMTVDELRELVSAGVELGGHSVTHPDLRRLTDAALTEETAGNRETLLRLTGSVATTFAYPHCWHDARVEQAVRDAGFSAAVAGDTTGWSPWSMPRTMITGIDGIPAFLAKLAGIVEPFRASRAGTAARVVSRPSRRALRMLRDRRAANLS